MKAPVLTSLAGTVVLCATLASAAGGITSPEPGSCHGPADRPVIVVDDFDGDDLLREYDPRGGMNKLLPAEPGLAGGFGSPVALDGNVLAVAASSADDNGRDSGAVYVFRFDGTRWLEEQRLTAGAPGELGRFGAALDLEGDLLVVGATGYTEENPTGVVYVFRHANGSWNLEEALTASDASRYDRFGTSVALQGPTLAVGAPGDDDAGDSVGAAYLFERQGGAWVERQKLVPHDPDRYIQFARALSLDGDTLAVGVDLDDDVGTQSGSVYVFRRTPAGWVHEQKLIGLYVTWFSRFGRSVSLDGDTLAVGSHPGLYGQNSGFSHIFERLGNTWTQRWLFRASDGHPHDFYGGAVRLAGGRLLVSAPADDGVRRGTGVVHYYHRVPTGWFWDGKRMTHDGSSALGWSLDLQGEVAVLSDQGGVYVDGKIPASHYELMGDYLVRLTVTDALGRQQSDSLGFTIDLVPPRVHFTLHQPEIALPVRMPFSQLFSSSDRDGASGGVVHERALWDECVLFDGSTYGNGDGLLSDEELFLDEATACEAILHCDLPGFTDPVVRIDVTDCGGNVGSTRRVYRLVPAVTREQCEAGG